MLKERYNFDFPSVKKLSQQTTVMLVNTDIAIDFPEPLQPNMIQVGGLQIAEAQPLPQVSQLKFHDFFIHFSDF